MRARLGIRMLRMGKASLTFTVIMAVVFATGERQATAQVSTATVDQYLTQVGEDASTTSRSFRESRSEEPEALASPDKSSDTHTNAANTPSVSKSAMTRDAAATPPGASASATTGDVEAGGGQAANLSKLPETGGPDATILLWGVIAVAALWPCLGIAGFAAAGARDHG
jgi:cytoskeletal protein RodZ